MQYINTPKREMEMRERLRLGLLGAAMAFLFAAICIAVFS